MTDEEIVEAMVEAYWCAQAKAPPKVCMRAALSIAKPLIAREAREMALQQAMIAVQGVINAVGDNPSLVGTALRSALRSAKSAILALSNNPGVGG